MIRPGVRLPLVLLLVATIALVRALTTGSTPEPPTDPRPTVVARDAVACWLEARGRDYYRARQWREAVAMLRGACEREPSDAEAHILLQNAEIRRSGRSSVVLPFIGSASGKDTAEARPDLYGLALAQEMVNRRGGVRGRLVVLDCRDDGSSTSRCLALARQMVADPSVLVVLGPANSQRTLAVAPLFNAAGLSLVAPTAASSEVWQAGPSIFSAADTRESGVRALADYVARAGFRRVAVVCEATSRLSREMAGVFEKRAGGRGISCLALPAYGGDPLAFDTQVAAAAAMRPDLIFVADYRIRPLSRFAAQLRAHHVSVPLCAQALPYERELAAAGGDSLEGLLLTDAFHPQIQTPAASAFVAAYRRKFGRREPAYPPAAYAYDAFMAVTQALGSASTRASIGAYLRSTGRTRPAFEGVAGRFALGRHLDARPICIVQLRDGRLRLVERVER